jgi:hypothetical protein
MTEQMLICPSGKSLARSNVVAKTRRDHATGQPHTAQDGLDPIASGLPWIAIRGRPFLSECADDNRFRYCGLSFAFRKMAAGSRHSASGWQVWSIFVSYCAIRPFKPDPCAGELLEFAAAGSMHDRKAAAQSNPHGSVDRPLPGLLPIRIAIGLSRVRLATAAQN